MFRSVQASGLSCSVALVSMALAAFAHGAAHMVSPDGSGDFPTIQAAIAALTSGDAILLADGTFTGDGNRDLDYLGKSIRIASQSGRPDLCILDSQGSSTEPHRGVNFLSGETSLAVLEGITITHGWADNGGAVYIDAASSPTITNCHFEDNEASIDNGYGGAIYCYGSATISSCLIIDNRAGNRGGGIFISGTGAISDCVIRGNSAEDGAGIHCRETVSITDCLIVGNRAVQGDGLGGGVSFRYHTGTIRRCTLAGNEALSGGGIAFYGDGPTVEQCIVVGGVSGGGLGWGYGGANSIPTIRCSDVWGNVGGFGDSLAPEMIDGGGNLHLDPLFCDSGNSVYTLQPESPCAPGRQDPDCGQIGAFPVACVSPTEITTWGRIKNRFQD